MTQIGSSIWEKLCGCMIVFAFCYQLMEKKGNQWATGWPMSTWKVAIRTVCMSVCVCVRVCVVYARCRQYLQWVHSSSGWDRSQMMNMLACQKKQSLRLVTVCICLYLVLCLRNYYTDIISSQPPFWCFSQFRFLMYFDCCKNGNGSLISIVLCGRDFRGMENKWQVNYLPGLIMLLQYVVKEKYYLFIYFLFFFVLWVHKLAELYLFLCCQLCFVHWTM